MNIDTIMIFAAGFGSRMKDITKDIPKSLIPINGKPIIYYAIENAIRHGFKRIIINSHYIAGKVNEAIMHFQNNNICPEIIVLYEDVILETGGGLKNALGIIDREEVFTANSDVIIKSDRDFFTDMEIQWNSKIMDLLLLLQKTEDTIGYSGMGDFEMDSNNKLYLRPYGVEKCKYMNTGVSIIKTSLVSQNSRNIFSLKEYYDDSKYRIYGTENIGEFFHLSNPENLLEIEAKFKQSKTQI